MALGPGARRVFRGIIAKHLGPTNGGTGLWRHGDMGRARRPMRKHALSSCRARRVSENALFEIRKYRCSRDGTSIARVWAICRAGPARGCDGKEADRGSTVFYARFGQLSAAKLGAGASIHAYSDDKRGPVRDAKRGTSWRASRTVFEQRAPCRCGWPRHVAPLSRARIFSIVPRATRAILALVHVVFPVVGPMPAVSNP